ncbi:MAG: YdeI/OmpD-associated family protein [Anaerolineae bacterium]|nr:YdeI/OmpD-associated family protein [Anaerolineae bacterium]
MPKPAFFKSETDLRAWFLKNHDTSREIVIAFYTVGSGKGGVTYKQAVDQALCFGWIDGIRKKLDDASYSNRFTPRKPKSIWSQVNLKRAAELETDGKMHAAGLKAYHGRDETRSMQYSFENKDRKLDPVREKKFRSNKKAWAWFSAQAPSYQRIASFWVISAKQEATRDKRLETLISDSEKGVRISLLRRPAPKAKY